MLLDNSLEDVYPLENTRMGKMEEAWVREEHMILELGDHLTGIAIAIFTGIKTIGKYLYLCK